uniref:Uncharacterized protein n=1 Tax=Alexandrium andersonii TaxID=327968 RepID=A0A7S2MJL0_9DINO
MALVAVSSGLAAGLKRQAEMVSEEVDADVESCTNGLQALTPDMDRGACAVVVGFERLWDTFDADKMQEAVDRFCKKDIDVQWALTNHSFYDMYGSNVQKRVKQFGGHLDAKFHGHFKAVEAVPDKVVLERDGATLNLHLPRRRFQKVLRTSSSGFPESHINHFDADCDGCSAMMHLVVEKTATKPDMEWEITEVQVIRV